MAVLLKFPVKDQLTERTEDGRPPENGGMDCVFTSTASGVEWLTGKFTSGDGLKDAVKGEAYRGGSSAAWLIDEVKRRGVALWHRDGPPLKLADYLREELAAGHPCLTTIPSHWSVAPADRLHPGSSHCVIMTAIDGSGQGGNATAMNPWHGVWQTAPVGWWLPRWCYDQVWPLARIRDPRPAWLPAGWDDDGTRLTAPGVPFVFVNGFRLKVLELLKAGQWSADDVPLENEWGAPLLEYGNKALGSGSLQRTRYHVLEWNAQMGVQLMWVGQELGALRSLYEASLAHPDIPPHLTAVYDAAGQLVKVYQAA